MAETLVGSSPSPALGAARVQERTNGLSLRGPGEGSRVAGPEGVGRGCRKELGRGGDPSEGGVPGPWSGRASLDRRTALTRGGAKGLGLQMV